jgi:hypothetical protein
MKTRLSRRQFIERSALITGVAASMPLVSFVENANAFASPHTQKVGNWETLKFTWDQPDNPDSGIPIGNGHLGARVSGGIQTESLALNDKWFWSGGPGLIPPDPARRVAMEETRRVLAAGDVPKAEETARGMWGGGGMGTFLPLGTLSIAFDHGSDAMKYSRVLDIDRALTTVKYTVGGVSYVREVFATFPDDVIVIRLTSSAKGKISFAAKLSYPPEMEGHGASVATQGGNTLVMRAKAPTNGGWDEKKGMISEARVKISAPGASVTATNGTVAVANADSAVLILANATSYNGFDKEPGVQGINPSFAGRTTLVKASAKSYDSLFKAHESDYQSLFRRVWVDINGAQPNATALGFQYARYEMIASSRVGDRPHNQQGIWNSSWTPSSHSAHWLNENVEKFYGLIETANLSECGEPLWNWMEELATNGERTATIDWGFRGWCVGQCTDIWARTCLDSGSNEWAIWPMGGVWLCNNLYDHYAFTLDKEFLRTRAYPLLKGAAEFCLDYLVKNKDGYLVTSPSTSPENRFGITKGGTAYAVTTGSAMDTALIRQLFGDTIQAATVLNVDEPFCAKLRTTAAQLPPFKISALEESKGELQEWYDDYSRLPDDPRKRFTPHRHASHIVSVWPLSQITSRSAPEFFAAAKVALQNRGAGGYHPDKAAMWARLGEGDKAMNAASMPTGNRITNSPPKYAAFPELLVQSHTDAIELLPALPSDWKSGHVSGLMARGAYEIGIEWQDGRLVRCNIDSRLRTTPKVRYLGQKVDLDSDPRISLNLGSSSSNTRRS